MRRVVDQLPLRHSRGGSQHEDLRRISAAISMLVHHQPVRQKDETVRLVNYRRKRTVYSSYPTSPAVSVAIARHLYRHARQVRRPFTVLDPTIEGAPLLLECAHLLAPKSNVKIFGIDCSDAVIGAVGRLFDRALGVAPTSYLRPELIHGDALAAMASMEPVDAVVNNPPWGERKSHLPRSLESSVDPCYFFVERALKVLKPGGVLALVLPGQVATSQSASSLRKLILDTCLLSSVTTLPTACFPRATVRALLLLGAKQCKRRARDKITLVHYQLAKSDRDFDAPKVRRIPISQFALGTRPWWRCASLEDPPVFLSEMVPLGSIARIRSGIVPYRVGRGVPRQTPEIVGRTPYTFKNRVIGSVALLRSRQITPFACLAAREYVRLGPHLAFAGAHGSVLNQHRIFVREVCSREGRLVAAPAPSGVVPRYGIFSVEIDDANMAVVCAILNSDVVAKYVRSVCDGVFKESFNRVRIGDLRRLPVPKSLLVPGKSRRIIENASRRLRRTSTPRSRTLCLREIETVVCGAYGVQQ
jgi:hypothetical protein